MTEEKTPKVDGELVRRLIAGQFPQWATLSIEPVDPGGWDNRTFRLGKEMLVRLPSARPYKDQVTKEQQWLPKLASQLPLPIPKPLVMGAPGEGYPWNWSIYQWIDGDTASLENIHDKPRFARSLAAFLSALQRIDASNGPKPGKHNFFRGGPLAIYDQEVRKALSVLSSDIDTKAALRLWESAIRTQWRGAPVWLHGDVSAANLLVTKNRLSAVIDFGCMAVGDPACDLAIAWTLLCGESRVIFQQSLALDKETWLRGQGWALWKALIKLFEHRGRKPESAAGARTVIVDVLAAN